MEGLKMKYSSAYDSWVLEPSHAHNNTTQRHSSAETFASSADSARHSFSSATPRRHSFSPSPRYFADFTRYDNGRFWKSLKKYWTCFKPPTHETQIRHDQNSHYSYNPSPYYHHHAIRPLKKEKPNIESCSDALASTNTLTNYYTAMSNEEREENLKAVVLYCKSSSS